MLDDQKSQLLPFTVISHGDIEGICSVHLQCTCYGKGSKHKLPEVFLCKANHNLHKKSEDFTYI